uniref:Putative Plant self-incompatibility protein S1 family n=1 Tax=Davidia involucrata TaxID=16924 RepID=A0A5B6ZF71_DAVIN
MAYKKGENVRKKKPSETFSQKKKMATNIHSLILVLVLLSVCTIAFADPPPVVHIENGMPGDTMPLYVRCVRRGSSSAAAYQVIMPNDEYLFNAEENDVYICEAKSGNKYNDWYAFVPERDANRGQQVYWTVTKDGFFLKGNSGTYKKEDEWYTGSS